MAQSEFDIQAWMALLSTAYTLGNIVYEGVRSLASKQLAPDDLTALEEAWDADVARSARNAGIPYNPDQPL